MNDNFYNKEPFSINSVWTLLHETNGKRWEGSIFKIPKLRT